MLNLLLRDLIVVSLVYRSTSRLSNVLHRFSLLRIRHGPLVTEISPSPLSCIYLDDAASCPRVEPLRREAANGEYISLKNRTSLITTCLRPQALIFSLHF